LHYWSLHLMLHALSYVHAPLLHLLHMPPWNSYKVMLAAHPCSDKQPWKQVCRGACD
jgi:hypothetical protein